MNSKLKSPSARRSALRLTYFDGAFYSIMVGTAESFAIFYGLKRGLSVSDIAVIATLPILIGAIAQWLIPLYIPNHKLKTATVVSVSVQLVGLFALLLLPFTQSIFSVLLMSLILYWLGGMVAAPLWLDWISPWLPHRSFSTYLSRRNGMLSLVALCAFVGSALLVNLSGSPLAFEGMFALAAVSRLISLTLLIRQPTPGANRHPAKAIDLAPTLAWVTRPVYYVIAITTLFKFAANISAPFFMPYMVQDLKLTLMPWVMLSAVPFAGRWLFLSRWGRVAKTFKPFIVLQATMFTIAINPALWTFTRDARWLSAIETLSGVAWGGFDLCAVLIIQNFWPGSARRLMGFHLAAMSLASLLGAALGSQLFAGGYGYHELFLISSAVRVVIAFASVAVLYSVPETRYSLKVYGDFLATVLTFRPSLAGFGRILPLRRKRNEQIARGPRFKPSVKPIVKRSRR